MTVLALDERRQDGEISIGPIETIVDAAVPAASDLRARIIDGMLVCIARYGFAKTTFDDVARAAGCSRATIYRVFPGGKDHLVQAVVLREVDGLLLRLDERVSGVDDLEGILVGVMDGARRHITSHAPLQFLLAHEPEVVLPAVAFSDFDNVLAVASDFLAPYLKPWLADEDARRVGEWVTRIVISYLVCPPDRAQESGAPDEERLRHVVKSFVLPGVSVLRSKAAEADHADKAGKAAEADHADKAAKAAEPEDLHEGGTQQ